MSWEAWGACLKKTRAGNLAANECGIYSLKGETWYSSNEQLDQNTIHELLEHFDKTNKSSIVYRDNKYIKIEVDENIARFKSYQLGLVAGLGNELAYDKIIASINEPSAYHPNLFFIDGPGGSEKTYLFRTILKSVRSSRRIILVVASSGIAALLFKGGTTAHSRFKIPINIHSASTCRIPFNSALAEMIRKSAAIIWDEALMMLRYVFETVDRSLQDIMQNHLPFGGKVVVLGDDFRQILPVQKKVTPALTVALTVKHSLLWRNFRQLKLSTNLRVDALENASWASFLLAIGEGRQDTDADGNITLPHECVIVETKEQLIHHIFGDQIDSYIASKSAILATQNKDVDEINDIIIGAMHGEEHVYHSLDTFTPDDEHNVSLFPPEFLNSLTIGGLPPHRLRLKIECIVIALRNLSAQNGLTNGTRVHITQLHSSTIHGVIITEGNHNGKHVSIPRINLIPTDESLPFSFQRRQFPVRLAFAMSVNKSQGQTLQKVGLYFRHKMFTHGQLYVALSRTSIGAPGISAMSNKIKNIVYDEQFLQ